MKWSHFFFIDAAIQLLYLKLFQIRNSQTEKNVNKQKDLVHIFGGNVSNNLLSMFRAFMGDVER